MTQIEQVKELFWKFIDGDITAIVDLLKVGVLLILASLLAKPYAVFAGVFAVLIAYQRWQKNKSKRREQESKEREQDSRTREQNHQEEITRIMLDGMKDKMKSEGLTGEEPNLKRDVQIKQKK